MVRFDRQGNVAVVVIANPPVNAIGKAVRESLLAIADEIDADATIKAVILAGAGKMFIGGADISEFGRPVEAPIFPDVVQRIEDAGKPWIAAVHGSVFGGGLELALACHGRIAASDACFALPEISLGLVPGAGGTQRLPRLIGVENAIPIVAENKRLDAETALQQGLVDRVAEHDLMSEAIAFARQSASQPQLVKTRDRLITPFPPRAWEEAAARISRSARGAAAPALALQVLRHGVEHGFSEGIAHERATFLTLRDSPQSAALRHHFFAERAAGRPSALKDVPTLPIRRVGVIGAGTMGTGISAALRNAGYNVMLIERDQGALDRGLRALHALFQAAERKEGTAGFADARMAGVSSAIDLGQLGGCELVIEAVFEELAVKQALFAELDRICEPATMFATNTSYINPRLIANGLADPGHMIGLHFFSPAQVMRLIEIIPLAETRPTVLATAFEIARKMGKVPVQSGICEGFIGNRILRRYRLEAEKLLCGEVAPSDIDAAMRGFGFAMGPFEMQDMAGLDISFLQREAARARGEVVNEGPGDLLVRAGRKGRKTGGGWYDYAEGDRTPRPSAEASAILAPLMGPGAPLSSDNISAILLKAMADEGQAILNEGIAAKPADIDLVEVHGYGFPRWRGGPMFMASHASARRSEASCNE